MTWKRFVWGLAFLGFGLAAVVQAQVPPSQNAGAVLWNQQRGFGMQYAQPDWLGFISPSDIQPPQEPVITIEEGVLPQTQSGKSVQGVIITPSNTTIGPSRR